MSKARELHAENVERARQAAQREQERQQRQRDEAHRKRQESDHLVKQEQERRAYVATQMHAQGRKRPPEFVATQSHPPRYSAAKRQKGDDGPILVWEVGTTGAALARETLAERAMHEGCVPVKDIDVQAIKMSMRDGTALLCDGNGTLLSSHGDQPSAWRMSCKWKNLVAGLVVQEKPNRKVEIKSDGGKRCQYIGSGTFNVVLSYPPEYKVTEHASNTAWRITRPDTDKGKHKYQTFDTCVGEVYNALFCSANGIGVPIQGIGTFEACRNGRSLHYGVVMAMARATCDLTRKMDKLTTEKQGALVAESVIDLLYRASRMGILFADIKPGNLLIIPSDDGSDSFQLTDYDPAFFLKTDKDWRSLLLLNLALLSAHVHNADFGAAGRGWAKAVAPLLSQLVSMDSRYDGAWLFDARAVDVPFMEPLNKTDFELQKLFVSVWTSYFYMRDSDGLRSKNYQWKHVAENNAQLKRHWSACENRGSWPSAWSARDASPLISQVVDFALYFA
jgi:hypothetical protein